MSKLSKSTNKFESNRPSRSDKYQWIINEVVCDIGEFAYNHDLESRLYCSNHTEAFNELNDQALECIMQDVQFGLTERQGTILRLYFEGYTQTEIAKMLGVNQSSIVKSLKGNNDYNNQGKVYGGALKKLRGLMLRNDSLKMILREMPKADDIFYRGTIQTFYQTDRSCAINLYYLVSTLFKTDEDYLLWQQGLLAPPKFNHAAHIKRRRAPNETK